MDIERLGKYEIQGTLGKGAMGTVYAGWDPVISRKVAIKTVRLPDAADIDAQEELARFKREAQAAGRLTHPNIVGVFDYGETDAVAYIVMEFVDGTTLKALLDAGERMAVPQVGRVMADLLAGLAYSHERGVIHRDIKPANIMIVGGEGHGSGQAKIADFGIARIESSNMTQAGTIMGTPAYMSPEQFMGQTVDLRTDIYSSGVLLFQLLTGDRPFEGSMATIMHKALNTEPPKPSELSVTAPAALDMVVARAMAKRPEERYASASEFAAAIQAALVAPASAPRRDDPFEDATVISTAAPKPSLNVTTQAPVAAAPKPKSRVPMVAGLAVIVVALAGGGVWFALSGRSAATGSSPPPAIPTPVASSVPPPPVQIQPPSPPPPPPVQTAASAQPAPTAPPPPQTATPAIPTAQPQVTQVVPPQPALTNAANAPLTQAPVPATAAPPAEAQPQPAIVIPPAPEPVQPARAPTPPVPTTEPPQQVASVGFTPEALRRAVASAVAGVDCAVVGGDAGRGSLILTGAVGSGRPEQSLQQAVQSAAPGAAVDWRLGVLSGPYCGVLDALRGFAKPFGGPGPVLQLATKDARTAYQEGDHVELRSVMPDYASYLQIDYFQGDGTVSHLLKGAAGTPVLLAGTVKDLLAGEVGAPFGTDLVVGIASSTALFGRDASLPETTEAYVRELRAALEAASRRGARLAVSTLVLRTSKGP